MHGKRRRFDSLPAFCLLEPAIVLKHHVPRRKKTRCHARAPDAEPTHRVTRGAIRALVSQATHDTMQAAHDASQAARTTLRRPHEQHPAPFPQAARQPAPAPPLCAILVLSLSYKLDVDCYSIMSYIEHGLKHRNEPGSFPPLELPGSFRFGLVPVRPRSFQSVPLVLDHPRPPQPAPVQSDSFQFVSVCSRPFRFGPTRSSPFQPSPVRFCKRAHRAARPL